MPKKPLEPPEDPTLALIEEHRAAFAAWRVPGSSERAFRRQLALEERLRLEPVATVEGLRAKIEYFCTFDVFDGWPNKRTKDVLTMIVASLKRLPRAVPIWQDARRHARRRKS